MPILSPFRREAAELVSTLGKLPAEKLAVTTPPKPELGDFAVGCFAAGQNAAAVAKEIAAAFRPTARLMTATATGPYVNFAADRAALFRQVLLREPIPAIGAGKTVVVDFSSPNIAKPLAYHHIRSTMIGHALVEM